MSEKEKNVYKEISLLYLIQFVEPIKKKLHIWKQKNNEVINLKQALLKF